MLPNLSDCNYFKKSHITYGEKDEGVMIYRLKSSEDYTFLFTCPKCRKKNEFSGALDIRKMKMDSKKKESIFFGCPSCGSEFYIDKIKVAGMRGKKAA